ncbi:tyrosine-type recombinase/integrase [Aquitalea magnusonii]|uniref:tyrosine-type recombinase/integrase n=1 Tax=Aquitalea magnusonii TaxID=332411 RepID=UPI000B5CA71A|nr:site-specific integrase [Aquitalea magnusonii]
MLTHIFGDLPHQQSKAIRTQRQPAMPWQDLPQFYVDHFKARKTYDITRSTLLFLILTAARSGEVRGMTWSEVDLKAKVWVIPPDRMKAKVQHRVPLSDVAIEILRHQIGLHQELVFPSPLDSVVLSDMVLTAYLRRVRAPSDVEGRVATAHEFRSSFRDWCSENGFARDLAERALAHTVENKVEAAYHRTDLLEQRRPMMDAWASFITGR